MAAVDAVELVLERERWTWTAIMSITVLTSSGRRPGAGRAPDAPDRHDTGDPADRDARPPPRPVRRRRLRKARRRGWSTPPTGSRRPAGPTTVRVRGRDVAAIRFDREPPDVASVREALAAAGLEPGRRPVVVLVGGAAGLGSTAPARWRALFL